MTNKIILDSLQDIEISGGARDKADTWVELLKQLLSSIWGRTKVINLKNVEMNVPCHDSPLSDELCKKIHGMCPLKIKIKSNMFPEGFTQD
jgi:hypothetical protein